MPNTTETLSLKKIVSAVLCAFIGMGLAFSQPVANFSSNVISGCAPLIVQFTDLSTDSPTSWSWDFGNFNTSNLQNPGAFYTTPGIYTVKLTATNSSGSNTISKTAFIQVFPTPTADFVSADTFVCNPATANFTDLSLFQSAPINSWFWNFGDGYSSSLQNPSHNFSTGNYTIFLTIKDTNGCSDFKLVNEYIHVNQVNANFTIDPTICPIPKTVNFTNTSTGSGLIYDWDFGDGNTSNQKNPSHNYASLGAFIVNLVVSDTFGCTSSVSHAINAVDLQTDFDFTVSCTNTGFKLNFTENSSPSPTSRLWLFGDGTTSGSANPSHTYSSYEPYTITLISALGSGCVDTVVKVYSPPKALFFADSFSCKSPFPVIFNNQSTGNSLSYLWNFGGFSNSTLQNPSFTYTSNKIVDSIAVSLTVTDVYGCANTYKDIEVIKKPQVTIDADVSSGCVPLEVNFTDMSQSKDSIVGWYWDLGNGQVSNNQTVNVTYSAIGEYDLKLVVTTAMGCKDSIVKSDFIKVGIKPDYLDITQRDTVCFHNIYSWEGTAGYYDTSIHVNSWNWSFAVFPYCMKTFEKCRGGDRFNTQDILFDTGHWSHKSNDTIMFYAGYNGCFDTIFRVSYTVRPVSAICHPAYSNPAIPLPDFTSDCPPLFASPYFTAMEECSHPLMTAFWGSCSAPFSVELRNCAFDYDTILEFYLQDLQTGAITELDKSATAINAITLTKAGLYQVVISSHNDTTMIGGCTDRNQNFLIPIDSVSNGFKSSIKSICASDSIAVPVAFTDTTTSLLGAVTKWAWDFGDGNVLINKLIKIPTNYTDTNYVYSSGTDSIAPPDNHNGLTSGTYQNPIHIYRDTGTYIVKQVIIVENNYSKCCGSATSNIAKCYFIAYDTIHIDKVYAHIAANSLGACPGSSLSFTDSSVSTTNSVVQWQWDFGDGSPIEITQNPTHIYSNTGDYFVSLIVKDAAGCIDTLMQPLQVSITKPVSSFAPGLASGCTNEKLNFSNFSSGDIVAYYWEFGDGNYDTLKNSSHLYNGAGSYSVSLTVTDKNGCDSTLAKNNVVTIFDKPQAGFIANTLWSECPPLPVLFTDTSHVGIQSWNWNFGDGQSSALQNPNHVYTMPGNYDLSLIVTDGNGCKDTVTADNYIKLGGPSGSFSFGPKTGCLPLEVTFIANGLNTSNYSWDFGDGTIVNNGNDTIIHTYQSRGNFTPKLFLQDSSGCTAVIPNSDQIIPDMLYADFTFPDSLLCNFGNVIFTNSSVTIYATNYHWNFGDGDTSNLMNPVHLFDSVGSFNITLVATDEIGCTSSLSRKIEVNDPPVIQLILSETSGCVPLNIDFKAINNNPDATVNSWNWNFGDGTSGTSDQISHTFTTSGIFDVVLEARYADSACITDTLIKINAILPVADFVYSPNLIADQFQPIHFTNLSQKENSWHWDFGNGDTSNLENPIYAYQHAGTNTITLIVTDTAGCADTIVKEIKIIPIVPNVFTPNGDGINDYFTIDGIELENCGLRVLNRWGNVIYETDHYQNDWRGKTTNGAVINDGVYYYVILCDYLPETYGYVHIINE